MDKQFIVDYVKSELWFEPDKDVVDFKANKIVEMVEKEMKKERFIAINEFVDFLKSTIKEDTNTNLDKVIREWLYHNVNKYLGQQITTTDIQSNYIKEKEVVPSNSAQANIGLLSKGEK